MYISRWDRSIWGAQIAIARKQNANIVFCPNILKILTEFARLFLNVCPNLEGEASPALRTPMDMYSILM